jgi:transposase-like protein
MPISSIRKDGETQHRTATDLALVSTYSDLLQEGTVFPPITVWWDGSYYWLTDGFHRIAAASRAGFTEIMAEVKTGSLADAQWDSYSANYCHGLRWSAPEVQRVIELALAHPNASQRSNVEIAKHLHISENTVRRWRKKLTSPYGEDETRIVTRGCSTYPIATKRIGRSRSARRFKSRQDIRQDLNMMKDKGSPRAQRLLVIIGNWALGCSTPMECLDAIERLVGS